MQQLIALFPFCRASQKHVPHTSSTKKKLLAAIAILFGLALTGCASIPPPQVATQEQIAHPIRFLLTFDDGPSPMNYMNPTESVLADLASNPVQPGIKALFFVQTRGATIYPLGQSLMKREYTEGHLIGLHTATNGHRNHRFMAPADFLASLDTGINDITKATGVVPKLVRPPFWSYDARTFAAYQDHGLGMMLTDLSANDGVIWGFNASFHKRSNLYRHLAVMRPQLVAGTLPVVDGVVPIVVTFHDVNSYTARNLIDYLKILLDVAKDLNIPVSSTAFYNNRVELERAAHARAIQSATEQVALPGMWGWLWTESHTLFGN
jgi:peptidoglycan/xylan/chitin deacetylase (PgdA/CDA1 family)